MRIAGRRTASPAPCWVDSSPAPSGDAGARLAEAGNCYLAGCELPRAAPAHQAVVVAAGGGDVDASGCFRRDRGLVRFELHEIADGIRLVAVDANDAVHAQVFALVGLQQDFNMCLYGRPADERVREIGERTVLGEEVDPVVEALVIA